MNLKHFWYVIAESHELTGKKPLSRQVLNEWLVCFRGDKDQPIVLQDRCIHRCAKLSEGTVKNGQLTCPYHGWVYGNAGKVEHIPSTGKGCNLKATCYDVIEQDGYIYVRLEKGSDEIKPFPMPHYKEKGWRHYRMQNLFHNNVTNCVENFIDVPHTAFVHEGIFRSTKKQSITARIERRNGEVHITYNNESNNLGSFSWALNPSKKKIEHTDSFFMPNITHVIYRFPSGWEYVITSQSVPITDEKTLVYTDLTYRFGLLTPFAKMFIKKQGLKAIAQDVDILNQQMETLKKYDEKFIDMPADLMHRFITEIRGELSEERDPTLLPEKDQEVTFFV